MKKRQSLEWMLARLDRSGECWPWLLSCDKDGYGNAHYARKKYPAHRLILKLLGVDVPDTAVVRHRCNNPPCCRPDHLLVGSQQENVDDMMRAGRNRQLRGQACGAAKLSDADVRLIRSCTGIFSNDELAAMFGCSSSNVYYIVSGRSRRT